MNMHDTSVTVYAPEQNLEVSAPPDPSPAPRNATAQDVGLIASSSFPLVAMVGCTMEHGSFVYFSIPQNSLIIGLNETYHSIDGDA
jgi:hypothetical protein